VTDRLTFIEVPSRRKRFDFANAVCDGLRRTHKALPSRFFYDHRGSELFEQITALPEYYLTRAEASIFEGRREEIISAFGPELSLVEFGSGSSAKTRRLIETILGHQPDLDYAPIDISKAFLHESSESLLSDFTGLRVTALAAEYFDAVHAMPTFTRPRLILFLGSNIGNFEFDEAVSFLSGVAPEMEFDDRVLVGTDLVKDPQVIHDAYNDAEGVTAAFNLNLLARINAELGGDFDLDQFEHDAPYLPDEERVEMRLVSKIDQSVCLEKLDLAVEFTAGEAIHTEFSQKYTFESFGKLASESGLEVCNRWTDERGWFALNMLRRSGPSVL
jgi:L-histidine N-alpha-methyltransferase